MYTINNFLKFNKNVKLENLKQYLSKKFKQFKNKFNIFLNLGYAIYKHLCNIFNNNKIINFNKTLSSFKNYEKNSFLNKICKFFLKPIYGV